MKEDFLHYLWRFQKFESQQLFTVQGELIQVISPGIPTSGSGPDFSNAKIWIGYSECWNLRNSDYCIHQMYNTV